uniref:Metallo-beta-lactamase domain-containing protein n=1 Tax=Aplanochytrium stocchinoi TaxID=215587 RepID=A0A7S3PIT8_9STRA
MAITAFLVPFAAFLVGGFLTSSYSDGLLLPFVGLVVPRLIDTMNRASNDPKWWDDSIRLLACGTGTPIPDKTRASQCMLVAAGGEFLLFDTGDGSAENLMGYGIPFQNLSGIFFTHYHSDHIADFGEVVLGRWLRGGSTPLDVYGPPGIERISEAYQQAYYLDSTYRIAHHGAENLPPEGRKTVPHKIELCGTEYEEREAASQHCTLESRGKVVLDRNGVQVTAFLVHHEPARPAYGYRVDYKGRSVTISGDTVPCEELIHYAKDTDLLVHDAINHEVVQYLSDLYKARGDRFGDRLGHMFGDILDYHSNPNQAINNAADANVTLLVLTHMVPPRRNAVIRRFSRIGWGTKGARNAHWKGEFVEADDGMLWTLKPLPSKEIDQSYVVNN